MGFATIINMEKITNTDSVNPIQANKLKNNNIIPGQFDSMLNSGSNSFAMSFIDNISNSLNNLGSALFPQSANALFPLTSAFTSTFGSAGPLPSFINLMSAKLHLSVAQNQAFQDIAVRNKDVTNTRENVQKIALELKKAGITS